jgi:hypothetical protein
MAEQHWHIQETYRGLVTLSTEELKALALVNGGACVALLTYIGHGGGPAHAGGWSIAALVCWSMGLVLTILAFIVAYVTQLKLFQEERDRAQGKVVKAKHALGVNLGICCAITAAGAFAIGCILATIGLA